MSFPRQYRQGDVLLVATPALPAGLAAIDPAEDRVVLAYGEVTGHAHALGAERVRYFREDGTGRGFIQITGTAPVALRHEEHDPIQVEPGTYEVRLQREYQPRALPRLVGD